MKNSKFDMLIENNFVKTNGIQLHYVTAGTGPLVIFLHGFPECWYAWRYQMLALADQFRVVALDLRGFNKSDKPKGIKPYSLLTLAEDIYGVIKGLGEQKAIVVSHDWGSGVAWQLAMTYPDVVEKLVIMNCPHQAVFFERLRKDIKKLKYCWYILFYQLPWLPELLWRFKNAKFLAYLIRKFAIRQDNISDEDLTFLRNAFSQPSAINRALNYYRALLRDQIKYGWSKRKLNDWPKIKAPTLLLWAENDIFQDEDVFTGMEPLFDSTLKVIPVKNCGHWMQQEQPELVNGYLQKFLNNMPITVANS